MSNVARLAPVKQGPDRSLSLAELPPELVDALAAFTDAAAKRASVTADFNALNMGFDNLSLRRADGTLFPSEGRAQALADLFNARREAERTEEAARSRLNQLRRAFGDAETFRIEAVGNALCAEMRERLEELECLFDSYALFQSEARSRSIAVRHQALDAAMAYRSSLHQLRGKLIPPIKFEGRR